MGGTGTPQIPYLLGNLPQVKSLEQAGCRVCMAVLSGQAIVDQPVPRYNFAISLSVVCKHILEENNLSEKNVDQDF